MGEFFILKKDKKANFPCIFLRISFDNGSARAGLLRMNAGNHDPCPEEGR
jgi:hypothetical protein